MFFRNFILSLLVSENMLEVILFLLDNDVHWGLNHDASQLVNPALGEFFVASGGQVCSHVEAQKTLGSSQCWKHLEQEDLV